MRILVTGGAGFIGANFLNMMVPRHPEHTFLCFDKLTYAGNPLSLSEIDGAKNFALEVADIADPEAVSRIFGAFGPDVVVHFAAESHVD
ncbi:MAG TPA: GDP-mannose 4,6-dehydratase, partial [Polyangiaceae bacterium]|nr:GDP-mannose 4,6-dehydratase [Polyangiaceae bacterium]